MARPGMTFEFPDFNGLADQFRLLPKSLAATSIAAGVKRAMQPAVSALKSQTPVGPTGNLRRGVAVKSKRYANTGTAIALVGYRKPGSSKPTAGKKRRNKANDLTYHQFWVEYGTKPRRTKSGANRGRMPALRPVQEASAKVMPQVAAALQGEMVEAYQRAVNQLPRYLAARARRAK